MCWFANGKGTGQTYICFKYGSGWEFSEYEQEQMDIIKKLDNIAHKPKDLNKTILRKQSIDK